MLRCQIKSVVELTSCGESFELTFENINLLAVSENGILSVAELMFEDSEKAEETDRFYIGSLRQFEIHASAERKEMFLMPRKASDSR